MSRARKDAPRKPNLFIVGAPKCGTTAWFEYLSTHPDVFVPQIKEPHFFAFDLPRKQWTDSQARYESLFAGAGDAKIVAEASVMYLFSTAAAKAIRRYNPNAKILIFLRKQEDFLPSLHHQFLFSFFDDLENFDAAWRLSGQRDPGSIPDTCPHAELLDYAAMGRFHEQVARYFAEFPADQIRVVQFDDWVSDPRSTYLEILDFLGLPDDGRTDFRTINEARSYRFKWLGRLITHPPAFAKWAVAVLRKVTGRPVLNIANRASRLFSSSGYKTTLSPELREEIRLYFEEDNRRLAGLLSSTGHPTRPTSS